MDLILSSRVPKSQDTEPNCRIPIRYSKLLGFDSGASNSDGICRDIARSAASLALVSEAKVRRKVAVQIGVCR